MANQIHDIEGIGPTYSDKLVQNGITQVSHLLEKGATKNGRSSLAAATGIDESRILKWVNMADLFRIKGIGEEYSQLLEISGVDTVKELGHRVPANLHAKMLEINNEKKLMRTMPSLVAVENWVEQAKSLEPVVKY